MRRVVIAAVSAGVTIGVGACGGTTDRGSSNTGEVATASARADLAGAGSTFAYPLYSKWAAEYARKTGVTITYASIGSGDGIRRFSDETIDFGGTDGPMSDSELAHAKGGAVLHVPTALGADVVMYNLPDVVIPLKFTPDVLAGIFLGTITEWNDPQLVAVNPDAKLPKEDILVVHRSDGSGTTYVWTDYMSSVSAAWANGPGRGKAVAWPVGASARGNEGVAGFVKQSPGAIGYVELAYARQVGLPVALVRNAAGEFIAPTVQSISAAAAGVAEKLPPNTDYRVSIVNAPGAGAYPIASFTWMLVYKSQTDSAKRRRLVDFLRWGLTEGQTLEPALGYASLPPGMLAPLKARLDSITVRTAPTTAGPR